MKRERDDFEVMSELFKANLNEFPDVDPRVLRPDLTVPPRSNGVLEYGRGWSWWRRYVAQVGPLRLSGGVAMIAVVATILVASILQGLPVKDIVSGRPISNLPSTESLVPALEGVEFLERSFDDRIISLINEVRVAANLRAVTRSEDLRYRSILWSNRMLETDRIDVNSNTRSNAAARDQVIMTFSSTSTERAKAEEVFTALMNSERSRTIILDPSWQYAGSGTVGIDDWGDLWTTVTFS